MHIPPQSDLRPLTPLASRPSRRRRLLRPMLVGSLVLHVLLVLLALWLRPDPEPQPSPQSDEVAMVFENPTGSTQASTESPDPSAKPATAAGSQAAPVPLPNPDNTPAQAPAPPPAPQPPVEPQPEVPPVPERPQPTPAPPTPAPPTPTPPAPRPPPTVSLNPDDELPPLPPAFQMPEAPPPLPPLQPRPPPPRPAPPRVARVAPRNPSPLSAPQDWSFNSAPAQPSNGRPSRGFDLSTAPLGGPESSSLGYVSGAKPSGDWMSALRRWVDARKYYPEQAIAQLEQGNVTLLVNIDRSGRVLSVQLAGSSRSQFLDGAFEDLFRRGTVPPFTQDMTEQTTTLRATMHFVLRQR